VSLVTRVVLDTSTLVSAALRPGSVPAQAWLRALASCDLCASPSTLDELAQVLRRPKFDRYLPLADRLAFVALVSQYSRPVAVPEGLLGPAACRDPRDVKFLALALASEARILVSSDADLLCLHPFQGLQVLLPAAFLGCKLIG